MNPLPDKKSDKLSKLITDRMLEEPSPEFTISVMNRLGLAHGPSVRYEPVITRTGWIVIAILTGLIVFFALTGTTGSGISSAGAVIAESAVRESASLIYSIFKSQAVLILATCAMAVLVILGAEASFRKSRIHVA